MPKTRDKQVPSKSMIATEGAAGQELSVPILGIIEDGNVRWRPSRKKRSNAKKGSLPMWCTSHIAHPTG